VSTSFHGVNIKLAKCGGLTRQTHDSRSQTARFENNGRLHDWNLRWDISNSSLITAIGLRRYGRALLLAEDIATGITRIWKTIYSEHNGTGVILL
jgi:hypothetical protein